MIKWFSTIIFGVGTCTTILFLFCYRLTRDVFFGLPLVSFSLACLIAYSYVLVVFRFSNLFVFFFCFVNLITGENWDILKIDINIIIIRDTNRQQDNLVIHISGYNTILPQPHFNNPLNRLLL